MYSYAGQLEVLLGLRGVSPRLGGRRSEHKHAEGWLFGVWAVYAGIERFLVEFLRAKDDRIAGLARGTSPRRKSFRSAFLVFGLIWMRMRRDVTAAHPGIHPA